MYPLTRRCAPPSPPRVRGHEFDDSLPSPPWGRGAGGEGAVSRNFARLRNSGAQLTNRPNRDDRKLLHHGARACHYTDHIEVTPAPERNSSSLCWMKELMALLKQPASKRSAWWRMKVGEKPPSNDS